MSDNSTISENDDSGQYVDLEAVEYASDHNSQESSSDISVNSIENHEDSDIHTESDGGSPSSSVVDTYDTLTADVIKEINKDFALKLMQEVALESSNWEPQEVASLALLLTKTLNCSKRRLSEILINSNNNQPEIIAALGDKGINFPTDLRLHILNANANASTFLNSLSNILECGLFNIKDADEQRLLYDHGFIGLSLTDDQLLRMCSIICSFSDNKFTCGEIVSLFTSNLTDAEAVAFALKIVNREWFLDLRGYDDQFTRHFHDNQKHIIQEFLQGKDENGRSYMRDSDEDEEGNLAGFINDEDEEKSRDDDANTNTSGSDDDDDDDDENNDEDDDKTDDEVVPATSRTEVSRTHNNRKRRLVESDDDDDDNDDNNNSNSSSSNDD